MKKLLLTILFFTITSSAVAGLATIAKKQIDRCDYLADGNPLEFRNCINL